MKYVPIVPRGAEWLLTHRDIRRVFCFADLAVQDSEYHKHFFETPKEVLLDHPIYELQPALDLFQTLDLLRTLQPDITTVPDKHEDYDATMWMFYQYAPAMREQSTWKTRLMGVPQGTSSEQIFLSALEMARTGLVDMLGISIKRHIPNLDRLELVEKISQHYPNMRYHLLGARWPYTNEQELARDSRVESLDSAEPVSAALRGIRLGLSTPEDVRRADNFQELANEARERSILIWENIWQMGELLRSNWHVTLAALREKDLNMRL